MMASKSYFAYRDFNFSNKDNQNKPASKRTAPRPHINSYLCEHQSLQALCKSISRWLYHCPPFRYDHLSQNAVLLLLERILVATLQLRRLPRQMFRLIRSTLPLICNHPITIHSVEYMSDE